MAAQTQSIRSVSPTLFPLAERVYEDSKTIIKGPVEDNHIVKVRAISGTVAISFAALSAFFAVSAIFSGGILPFIAYGAASFVSYEIASTAWGVNRYYMGQMSKEHKEELEFFSPGIDGKVIIGKKPQK